MSLITPVRFFLEAITLGKLGGKIPYYEIFLKFFVLTRPPYLVEGC